jgi:ribosomal protein L32
MGAVPKRKITSRRRGARRAKNKRDLKQDTNVTSTPLHKRSLVARIIKSIPGFSRTTTK